MHSMTGKILRSLPWIVASCVLYWASDQAQLRPPDLGFQWQDKLYHAVAYCLYGLTIAVLAQAWFVHRTALFRVLAVIVVGIAFGMSDEYHQTFVPGRIGSISDGIADGIGVLISAYLFARWISVRERG